jgi:hypothetical protein
VPETYSDAVALTAQTPARSLLTVAAGHLDHDRAAAAWEQWTQRHGDSKQALGSIRSGAEERLLPLIGERADLLGLDEIWRAGAAEATAIAWGLNERIFSEVAPVVQAFTDAGIEVLCFKGLGLVGDIYPQHHLRPIGDADLLVRPTDTIAALDIMERLGWRIPRGLRLQYRVGMTTENLGNGTGVSIDLHQHPARMMPESRRRLPAAWDAPEMLADDHPLAATGLKRPTPIEHALILATHHARLANAHIAHVAVDVHRMFHLTPVLQADDSGAALTAAARREYVSRRVGDGLRSLHRLLDTPIPASALEMAPSGDGEERIEQRAAAAEARIATEHGRRRLRDHVAATSAGLGIGERLSIALRVLTTWLMVRTR